MKKFFFDTADYAYIKKAWSAIKQDVNSDLVEGITTNPNAFFKVNKLSIKKWFDTVPYLCETVSEIRGDKKGVVYIQGPYSKMGSDELISYAEKISKLSDGNTRVGLKIPPYVEALSVARELSEFTDVNVTGVSDAATALKCFTYPAIRYVSVIPGRMEEVGIDAKAQIAFINQANERKPELIAGSMRTIEGLAWTFQYGTVPTIGERVWNLILEDRNIEKLLNIDYASNNIEVPQYAPIIDERSYNLSKSFFEQMDNCGKQAYSEL